MIFFLIFSSSPFVISEALECKKYTASKKYQQFIDLNSIEGAQSPGYIARFSFYVLGKRDAHIVLTMKNNPDWRKDSVYEICKFIFRFFFHLCIERRKLNKIYR